MTGPSATEGVSWMIEIELGLDSGEFALAETEGYLEGDDG